MFDNDAIRFPEFTKHLFESLLQPPTLPKIRVSQEGSGTLPPFPAFDPNDDVVSITLTLPQQTFSIPHPQYPVACPFPFKINQHLDLGFHPWQEPDDPMFLDEEAALFISAHIDVVLSQDLVCHGNDLPVMLHVYTRQVEEYFDSLRDHGLKSQVRVQAGVSPYPYYLAIEQLTIDIPCCLPVQMMPDTTFSGLMATVKPWVDAFYAAEAKLFQMIALTLWSDNMTLAGNTRTMQRMRFQEEGKQ
ncbi:MAG TPA: hypothetical protein VD886_15150 [Herpetosiphonaceae bacterium]|nr:hypothetical protein [Herpetosiphonaceae bacterium]